MSMSLCLYLHLFLSLSPALICLTVCGDYGIIWSRCEKLINGLSVPGATCVWLNCVSVWVAISKVSSEPSSPSPSPFTHTSASLPLQQGVHPGSRLTFAQPKMVKILWPIGCLLQLQLPLLPLPLLLLLQLRRCC